MGEGGATVGAGGVSVGGDGVGGAVGIGSPPLSALTPEIMLFPGPCAKDVFKRQPVGQDPEFEGTKVNPTHSSTWLHVSQQSPALEVATTSRLGPVNCTLLRSVVHAGVQVGKAVGTGVGAAVGGVGLKVGLKVGDTDGTGVGLRVGETVGSAVVGVPVGAGVGVAVGLGVFGSKNVQTSSLNEESSSHTSPMGTQSHHLVPTL